MSISRIIGGAFFAMGLMGCGVDTDPDHYTQSNPHFDPNRPGGDSNTATQATVEGDRVRVERWSVETVPR